MKYSFRYLNQVNAINLIAFSLEGGATGSEGKGSGRGSRIFCHRVTEC